jgi:hypothetical protein
MLPFVADTPPFLKESLAGELDVVARVLPCVCRSACHVEIGADLRNIPLEDETPWAEVLRITLHACEYAPVSSER